MKRWLSRSLLIAGLLVAVSLGAIAWLVGTATGSRWFILQAQQWVPGELIIKDVQGRLLDEWQISGLSYRYQDFSLRAASLHGVWRLGLNGVASVKRLEGEGLEMHIPPFSDEAIILPSVILPVRRIELHEVQLKPVTVQYADKSPFTLDSVVLRAVATDRLVIELLQAQAPWLRLAMEGNAGLRAPHPLSLQLHWSVPWTEQLRWSGEGVVGGTPERLTLATTVTRPVALQFEGVLNNILDVASKVNWTAALRWDRFEWPLVPRPSSEQALLTSQAGQLQAAGTKKDYRLELTSRLAGTYLPPGRWQLTAQGDGRSITLEKLVGELLQGTVTASGQADWQQPALAARLKLAADKLALKALWSDWPEQLRLDGELLAELDGQELTIKRLDARLPGTPAKLNVQGQYHLAAARPTLQTTLQWQALQWPLAGKEPAFTSSQGTLLATGELQAPQLELTTDLAGPSIPKGRWQASGQLTSNSLRINRLQADMWQGSLVTNGWFNCWFSGPPVLEWQATVSGDKLNPGKQWPDWPGELSGTLQSQGRWQQGTLDTRLAVQDVRGRLRGYPFKLQTRLAIQGRRYQLENLELRSGTNRLTGNAILTDTLTASWAVDAPELANLLPQARGSLSARGSVSGSLQAPQVNASLMGKGLVFQDQQLAQLQAEVKAEPNANGAVRLDLSVNDWRQAAKPLIKNLQVQLRGRLADHTVSVAVKTPVETLSLQLQGGLAPAQPFWTGQWQGSLQQLTATSTVLGDWTLTHPVALKFSTRQAQLAKTCLQHRSSRTSRTQDETAASLCTQWDWQATTGASFQAELNELSLSPGATGLPPGWSLTGALQGSASGLIRPDGTLRSEALLRLTPGVLTTRLQGETQQLHHQGGELRLTLTDQGLAGRLDLKLLKQSTLAATLELPHCNRLPLSSTQPLQGQLRMSLTELGMLAVLLPEVEHPQGIMVMDMTLAGTLNNPRLQGQLRLQNGALELPDWGLQLQGLNLVASATGTDTVQLQASLRSGEGEAQLSGDLVFASLTDWRLQARLSGTHLKIVDNPTAWIAASPHLTLTLAPGTVDVQGTVLIPEARLSPVISKLSEGAIGVSEDTVTVNPVHPKPGTPNGQPWHVTGQVKLTLADNITLKIADFKSHMDGSVLITKTPQDAIPVGNGELHIINGQYKAYGQNLEIDKGSVIFANQRLDNPSLDIKAVRRIFGDEPVKVAGVYIGGNIKSPKLSLFSDPPVEEKKILSYLTLGTALGEESESKPLGFGDSSKTKPYKVGMYVWPNLYVSYGIDFKRQGNNKVYNVRYEFGKQFWVEGEFKEEGNGVDFSYIIER